MRRYAKHMDGKITYSDRCFVLSICEKGRSFAGDIPFGCINWMIQRNSCIIHFVLKWCIRNNLFRIKRCETDCCVYCIETKLFQHIMRIWWSKTIWFFTKLAGFRSHGLIKLPLKSAMTTQTQVTAHYVLVIASSNLAIIASAKKWYWWHYFWLQIQKIESKNQPFLMRKAKLNTF